MAVKAILFDSSRCSACQACVAACQGPLRPRACVVVGGYGGARVRRAAVLDEEAPLAVGALRAHAGRRRHRVGGGPRRLRALRRGALRGSVPHRGAGGERRDGFRVSGRGPLRGRHLCAMVCPADAAAHRGERGELCLCDGCGAEVAEGSVPACVAACPLDALAFDDRDAVVSRANERAAVLRERGWANASVLGVSEQGGHHVVQVMKYGVGGSMHEALASTGEVEWLDAVKAAGPASVGVLGLAAAGAVAGLVSESRKQRTAEAEAAAASMATFNPLLDNESVEGGEGADGDAREVVEESALQAALRRRNALRTKKAPRLCCRCGRVGRGARGGVPLVQRRDDG